MFRQMNLLLVTNMSAGKLAFRKSCVGRHIWFVIYEHGLKPVATFMLLLWSYYY